MTPNFLIHISYGFMWIANLMLLIKHVETWHVMLSG